MDTGLDERASIRSYGDADVFFKHLVNELGLQVEAPPPCQHLRSAMQMKRLAVPLLPPSDGHYVGSEEKERQMADALTRVEADILAGHAFA
jgi:hypothetical protein